MDNITLSIDSKVYDLIVEYAYNFKLGARGLRSICEKLFLDAFYRMPSADTNQKKLKVDLKYAKDILKGIQFNKLKEQKASDHKFDSRDMSNFENFFMCLYSNNHTSITTQQKEELLHKADTLNTNAGSSSSILNRPISLDEIKASIKSLKNGKSSSSDMICNELLINLKGEGVDILHKLYNKCFDTGTYPWNNSIVSPLHKKGCKVI